MRKRSLPFFFLVLLSPFFLQAQKVPIIRWAQMDSILRSGDDSLTVLNFWATWCKPCVEELPHFEKLRKQFASKPVRFIYISLDFASEAKTRVQPFVNRKMQGATVLLLDETDYNQWINRIDPTWGGGIPMTLFFNNPKKIRIFADRQLAEEQLQDILLRHL